LLKKSVNFVLSKKKYVMKLKMIPVRIVAIFSLLIIFSCSKTEENIPIINITDLILTSDSDDAILVVGETVQFTVTGDDGVDYSDQATFYVNQEEIQGSSYMFPAEGNYSVYSSYGNVTSNTLTYDVVDASENLLLSRTKVLRDQTIEFTLTDSDGNDNTGSATFYVNGMAITGNTYATSTTGLYEVYAEYELAGSTQTSETKTFSVFIPKRKVMIEDYTGTWCGYCPSVAAAIWETHEVTDDISVVAIHETANSNPDPYHFPQVQLLKDEFGVDGLPAARLNRTTTWSSPYETSDVTAMAGENTDLSISISSNLSGNELSVDVKVIYENGSLNGDRLVVYLLENGLIHDQTNYYNDDPTSPFYQQGNPIPDFEHNEVLRLSLTDLFGDDIPETPAFTDYTRNLNVTIPSDYNTNNLELVAMVVSSDNTARNSQFAAVNENKEYE
jgi:thiol-disulfide isomerase/thioredoxin